MHEVCREMLRNLSACIDGELDEKCRAAVKDHIAACPSCAGELRLMSAVDADIKQLPAIEPSPFFAAKVAAAARAVNQYNVTLRRFLRVPVPAMAMMVSLIIINLFAFAFNMNAMENGARRELARKIAAQLVKPASIINPVALARLCGECNKYMCLCLHKAGKRSICPCKDCEMEKQAAEKNRQIENMEENINDH